MPALEPLPILPNPYSASGFDFLPLLARVVNRPHPQVILGNVDLSCSFVVVDVRRYDSPIVYCSPTFCRLTGYEEHEIVGRNCRFLQSPNGVVQRGEHRHHSTPEAIARLRKCLTANKECQIQLVNYRKGGSAFTNLLTVIPISGGVNGLPHEADDYVYHIGFQMSLQEQPQAIIQHVTGDYVVDYTTSSIPPVVSMTPRDRRSLVPPIPFLSNVLRTIFRDLFFIQSIPSSILAPSAANEKIEDEAQHVLNMLLLERSPDFIHVVSLKGSFLYVAPSVRNVLGYDPGELIGKSISEFCHPADLVPLMRELKESSTNTQFLSDGHSNTSSTAGTHPKTVDILFRAQSKNNGYLWVESRGRLHVEPGKGRKAIILTGRAKRMPQLRWASITRAGGLIPPSYTKRRASTHQASDKDTTHWSDFEPVQQEFWGMVTAGGTFLSIEAGVQDVLGWEPEDLIGKDLEAFCLPSGTDGEGRCALLDALTEAAERSDGGHHPVSLSLQSKDEGAIDVILVLFSSLGLQGSSVVSIPCPLVFQIRLATLSPGTCIEPLVHALDADVFEELEIGRGTSWQYELQQLKFANRRLAQEIHELEQQHLAAFRNDQRHHYPQLEASLSAAFPRQYSRSKRSWDSTDGPGRA